MEYERFRFGLFEFNSATRELRREGLLIRLQSQPTQVLACLIERPGQVVSRDDLRKALWGDDTFVDFDRGLNFCMSQIRAALKDDSVEPTYIRTIPKHGYQFIAPVERSLGRKSDAHIAAAAPHRANARVIAAACAAGIIAMLAFVASYQLVERKSIVQPPVVAVLRFDNETGNSDMDRFSDGLTDTVVEQLTSFSRDNYLVIGNAQILRLPRDQRDLNAIAASLHATYVVLGQLQSDGSQVRILAHLIRLPDQTHIWVVRTDRTLVDPLNFESEVAQQIATDFSPRIARDSNRSTSLPAVTP